MDTQVMPTKPLEIVAVTDVYLEPLIAGEPPILAHNTLARIRQKT